MRAQEIIKWYSELTPQTLEDIHKFYTENSYFKDAFHELNGREHIKYALSQMFVKLENPHFIFIDKVIEEKQSFMTWDFIFTYNKTEYRAHGATLLKLNDEGLIYYHCDYMDIGEQVMDKIPGLRQLYRFLRKRFQVKQ